MVINTSAALKRQFQLAQQINKANKEYREHLEVMLASPEPVSKQADIKLAQLRDEVMRLTNLAYPDM